MPAFPLPPIHVGGSDPRFAGLALEAGNSIANQRLGMAQLSASIENQRAQREQAARHNDLLQQQLNQQDAANYVTPDMLPPSMRTMFQGTPRLRTTAIPFWEREAETGRQSEAAGKLADIAGRETYGAPAPSFDLEGAAFQGEPAPNTTTVEQKPYTPQRKLAEALPWLVKASPAVAQDFKATVAPALKPVAAGVKKFLNESTGEFVDVPGESPTTGENLPQPRPVAGFPGMIYSPKTNEQTGRVDWSIVPDPNYRAGVITHGDALRDLQAEGVIPPDRDMSGLSATEHAAVVKRMTKLQAEAAGNKAANVTVNTGNAKNDIPVGKDHVKWVLPGGQLATPDMTPAQIYAAKGQRVDDAVKRLDSASAANLYEQHMELLKKFSHLFPESSGDEGAWGALKDRIGAGVSQSLRKAQGVSNNDLAEFNTYRTTALQAIRAMAPDARSGARLFNEFDKLLPNPDAPYTRQSFLAAIDAATTLAQTAKAQRGIPGQYPQPEVPGVKTVPPVSPASGGRGGGASPAAAPNNDPLGIRR